MSSYFKSLAFIYVKAAYKATYQAQSVIASPCCSIYFAQIVILILRTSPSVIHFRNSLPTHKVKSQTLHHFQLHSCGVHTLKCTKLPFVDSHQIYYLTRVRNQKKRATAQHAVVHWFSNKPKNMSASRQGWSRKFAENRFLIQKWCLISEHHLCCKNFDD